jgi:hypothetical protein
MSRFTFTKTPHLKFFALPGANAWELWALQEGQIVLVREIGDLSTLAAQELWLFALPVHQVYAVPMWVNATDDAALPDLIHLQLERRGLVSRPGEDLVMQYERIAQTAQQKLLLVTVLPEQLPLELQMAQAKQFEVSARFWPLPENEIVLFKEDRRIAVAVTRDDKLCYFQSIVQDELNPAAIHEVLCIRLQLEAQRIADHLTGITLWGEFSDDQVGPLGTALQLPVKVQAKPTPQLPNSGCRLIPHSVRLAHVESARKTKAHQVALSVAGLYVLFLLGWMSLVAWEQFETSRLGADLDSTAGVVQELSQTAARWRDLQPAINPELYPVELLYRSAQALPSEGVRLTLFEERENKLLITGEARNARAAFKFKEDLEKDKGLATRRWQMPQPQPLPNDSAKFQIEGVSSYATTH